MTPCVKHPKYTGKRIPKHECTGCLSYYLSKHNTPRTPIPPTRIVKDKSKYTRKEKHKKVSDA